MVARGAALAGATAVLAAAAAQPQASLTDVEPHRIEIVHTAIVVGGGFSLLLTCLLLGHAFGGGMPGAVTGVKVFIPLWLIGAGVNMWLGVSQAGYSAAEEFPIFLAIFGVPAVVAGLLWWIFS